MEETSLFEREEILSDENETGKVKLINETLLDDVELMFTCKHFTTPKILHRKLAICRSKEVVAVLAVLSFTVFLILGIFVVVHLFTVVPQSRQLELTKSPEINSTGVERNVLMSTAINRLEYISVTKSSNDFKANLLTTPANRAINNSVSISASVSVDSPMSGFSCFSPWFTRQSTCYLFSKDSKTWNDALASCNDEGGQLAQISDYGENMYVRLYARIFYNDFWIGLSYQSKYHGWIWNQNTTSVISSEYTSWTFGQPPTELNDGDCVALTKKSLYLWNVEHCDEKKRYICEKHT